MRVLYLTLRSFLLKIPQFISAIIRHRDIPENREANEKAAKSVSAQRIDRYNQSIEFLAHEHETIRGNGVVTLGYLKDSRAVDALVSTLQDESHEVRKLAVEA